MIIGAVSAKNFGPFESLEIDLSVPGVTLIEGRVDGRAGCSSNGAGKSTVQDLVAWTVFGRTFRDDWSGDALIRRGSKSLETSVEIRGEQQIVIQRYRKHPTYRNTVRLTVDGRDETRGKDSMTQEAIETLLQLDYQTFANTVAFGARPDVKSFFSAPDSTRKAILEKLLQLDWFTAAQAAARTDLNQARQAQAAADTLAQRCQWDRQRLEEDQTALMTDLVRRELEEEVVAARQRAHLAKKAANNARVERERLLATVADATTAYKEGQRQVRVLSEAAVRAEAATVAARTAWQQAKERHEEATATADALTTATCPTCGQELPEDQCAARKAELAKAATVAAERRATRNQALKAAKAAEEAATAAQIAYSAPEAPTLPDTRKQDKALASAQDAQREEESLATKGEARLEADRQQRDKIARTRARIAEEETKAEVQQRAAAAATEVAAYWVDGFGDKGIKSFLLEAALPEISQYATYYARRLFGDETVITLSATKQLKSKDELREQLDVKVEVPGATEGYGGGSKGQRLRLDVALLLSFRRYLARRAHCSFDQVFADEVLDGMDRAGAATLIDVLREVAKDAPVLLISHDDSVKDHVDRVVTVWHDGTVARLADGSKPTKIRNTVLRKRAKA